MKKFFSFFLALLILCLWMSASFAESVNGESGAYVNSWRPDQQCLAFAQGRLYCLATEKLLWNDYGVLVAVSKTSTERVLKKAGLKQIKAYQGNILLISREKSLGEMLVKNTGGTEIWDVFEPATGKTTNLLRYHIDTSPQRYFIGSDKVFYTTQDEAFISLYRKDDQGDVLLCRQTEKMGLEYPSYKSLCHREMPYDTLTKSYHWQNNPISVFDYVSETVLETDGAILPSNSSIFLESVLTGHRMYYLSAQGLNVWDFDDDTDTNIQPFDREVYTKFSLSGNTAALYGRGNNVDFYDLSTGELTQTVVLSVDPNNNVYLTDQEMYVFDRFTSQMEYIHLETGEHVVFTIK